MARQRKPRTITLSDEVFFGLRALALYRQYKGDVKCSASTILEELGRAEIERHSAEIAIITQGKTAMEQTIITNLFETTTDEK